MTKVTTIIQAKQLSFSYGKHQVLDKLDLTIKTGEIIGLIGENGAGKTTLLNLLLGVRTADSGELTVFDQTPGSALAKQKIGSMLQGDMAIRGVTVTELLTMAATNYPAPLSAATLITTLDLTAFAQQQLTALSGGQLRRVTFALALISNPDLLFLDEPTVGMDTNAQQAFWQRIQVLKAQGKAVIITSHYLPEIEQVADRILLLQDGRFAFQGTFATLQQRYQQVVITFQTALPGSTFDHLAGVTAVTGRHQTIKISSEDRDATLQALVPYLAQLQQVTINRESLSEIFVQLTKGAKA